MIGVENENIKIPHKHHDYVIVLLVFALFFVAFSAINKNVDFRLIVFDAATDLIILLCIAELWLHLSHMEARIYEDEWQVRKIWIKEKELEKDTKKIETDLKKEKDVS